MVPYCRQETLISLELQIEKGKGRCQCTYVRIFLVRHLQEQMPSLFENLGAEKFSYSKCPRDSLSQTHPAAAAFTALTAACLRETGLTTL